MSKIRILGIYRLPLFSNNAIEADRMILDHSIEALKAHANARLDIDFVEEPEISKIDKPYDLVLTMAQSAEALASLDQKKTLLPNIWNSNTAVRNCYRKRMSELLEKANVGYAPYKLVRSDSDLTPLFESGTYWLKRGDFHAISDDDVSLAETPVEARIKMNRFLEKDVKEVIVQKHITGDIYKFYGVGSDFFTAIRVRKFLETELALNLDLLKKNANQAAKILGLHVFGGDCILDKDGNIHIIDLNDWPSFRICREPAAAAIGSLAANFVDQVLAKQAGSR